MRAFTALLLLAALAKAETPEEAAEQVATAVQERDAEALRALAARDKPDPWLVAEALCARNAREAARAFAALAAKPDCAALPAYVEAATPDASVRASIAAATEALERTKEPQRALDLLKDIETTDPVATILILRLRGFALARTSRLDDGASRFEEAASRARELGWLAGVSDTLHLAGSCAATRSDFARARRNWEARVELDTGRGRRQEVASTLGNLGLIALHQGRPLEARVYQERTLAEAREIGDGELERNTMNTLAVTLQELGEHREAMALLEQLLALSRSQGDKRRTTLAIASMGNLRFKMGELREAERLLREALALREEAGDERKVADTCANLATVLSGLGRYDEALALANRALEVHERDGNRSAIAITLATMGGIHRTLGQYEEAERFYERGLTLSRETHDKNGIASGLTSLALVRQARGDLAGALTMSMEALEISRAIGAKPGIAVCLTNVGNVQWRLGRFREAISAHEESLHLHEEIGDKAGQAISLSNIAALQSELGDPDRAVALYRRARAVAEASGAKGSIVGILGNIALAEAARGNDDAALAGYEEALALSEEFGMQDSAAHNLGNIGLTHIKKGDHATGIAFLERARAIEERLGLRRKLVGTLGNIAEARLALEELEQALALRRQALAIAEEIGADEPLARQEWGLAKTCLAAGDAATALAYARRAATRVPDMLAGLGDVQGAGARTEWVGVYEVGASAAVALGDAAATCEFIEGGRGGAMLESLGGRDAIKSARLPPSLRDLEASARARLAVARRSHDDALRSGDRDAIRTRRGEMYEAATRVEEAVDRIQREAKQVGQVLYPKPRSLGEIQSALGDGDALVLFDLLHKQAIALVVRRGDARIVALGERAVVEAACGRLEGIGPTRDAGAAVERAREALVAPLGLGKETRRVLVSPDAAIHAVPFAALLPDREVAYVPSGTTFRLLREEKAAPGRDVLALGDPAYATHPRLPATRQEAEAVGDVTLLGADATPAGLASALGKRPRWRAVHLACHGTVDPRRPLLSALILAPSAGSDGMLSTADLFGLSIPADLVALSACETARGKSYEGEGVVGFVRAIMLAGAPRVLVSLWKVDDEATRALMVKFYELWRTRPAAAALREAQQSIASNEEWRHPYYWAAWQLWGMPD